MKKFWFITFTFVTAMMPLAATGQINIVDTPFLYKSPENFNDCSNSPTPVCFIDSVAPDLSGQHRSVPVRIRIPQGTNGRSPLVLWSHGGGLLENTEHPEFSQWLASYALAYFDSYLKKRSAGAYLISSCLPLQGSRKTVLIYRK
jgi:hypothetical protein